MNFSDFLKTHLKKDNVKVIEQYLYSEELDYKIDAKTLEAIANSLKVLTTHQRLSELTFTHKEIARLSQFPERLRKYIEAEQPATSKKRKRDNYDESLANFTLGLGLLALNGLSLSSNTKRDLCTSFQLLVSDKESTNFIIGLALVVAGESLGHHLQISCQALLKKRESENIAQALFSLSKIDSRITDKVQQGLKQIQDGAGSVWKEISGFLNKFSPEKKEVKREEHSQRSMTLLNSFRFVRSPKSKAGQAPFTQNTYLKESAKPVSEGHSSSAKRKLVEEEEDTSKNKSQGKKARVL